MYNQNFHLLATCNIACDTIAHPGNFASYVHDQILINFERIQLNFQTQINLLMCKLYKVRISTGISKFITIFWLNLLDL